jgi:L-cysteate sulfo-lyase
MNIAQFPRLHFAHLPTPLEPLERLSKYLGGPRIWIKRDDCTGLAGGGNKTRKLEFLIADALLHDADVIITQGATQSNHTRQTAAIAAQYGMTCHVLLEDRTASQDVDYNFNGNVLLDEIFGAHLYRYPGGTDMNQGMQELSEQLKQQGHRPYIIPGGGSNPIGALGYVNAFLELNQQLNDRSLHVTHLVHGTGSAGTQAGLVAAKAGINSDIEVLGIGVRAPHDVQAQNVLNLAQKTAQYIALNDLVGEQHVKVNCNYVGEGYGIPSVQTLEAISLTAQLQGILLDPVYSGKAMAGLIDLIRKGSFAESDNVVFLHTGGSQALFGYRNSFDFTDDTQPSVTD